MIAWKNNATPTASSSSASSKTESGPSTPTSAGSPTSASANPDSPGVPVSSHRLRVLRREVLRAAAELTSATMKRSLLIRSRQVQGGVGDSRAIQRHLTQLAAVSVRYNDALIALGEYHARRKKESIKVEQGNLFPSKKDKKNEQSHQ